MPSWNMASSSLNAFMVHNHYDWLLFAKKYLTLREQEDRKTFQNVELPHLTGSLVKNLVSHYCGCTQLQSQKVKSDSFSQVYSDKLVYLR